MRFFYLIFKYLTSIVKPCVFKLFSLRKITKSNFFHHLPTLNIANLFMQSFASPSSPSPTTPHHNPHTPQKSQDTNHAPQFTPRPTKRAQLTPIPTPFLPKNPQKGRNYRLYPRPFHPKNHRKGATIAAPQEKFVKICANSWLKTTNTDSTNHTDFPLNPCNNFNHKLAQIKSSLNPLKIR